MNSIKGTLLQILSYILILTLIQLASCADVEVSGNEPKYDIAVKIELTPPQLRIQVGKDGEFNCKTDNETAKIEWLNSNATKIDDLDNPRIKPENGTLKFINATLAESGDYICRGVNFNGNETATLKVYFMPSYFKEGMIIVAINGALFVLFIMCTIYAQVKECRVRKDKEKEYKPTTNVDS